MTEEAFKRLIPRGYPAGWNPCIKFYPKASFLQKHPTPTSIVVAEFQVQSCTRQIPVPPSKERRKLDAVARNIYSFASLIYKISDCQGAMGPYQLEWLAHLQPLLEFLPEDKKADALSIFDESMALVVCSLANLVGTCLRQFSISKAKSGSLCPEGLSDDQKSRIENLPFEGDGLFHPTTDDLMEDQHKNQNTAKKLNLIQQCPQQSFRFQPRRLTYTSGFRSSYSSQINVKKSKLTPSPVVSFIRTVLNANQSMAYPPQDRFHEIFALLCLFQPHFWVEAPGTETPQLHGIHDISATLCSSKDALSSNMVPCPLQPSGRPPFQTPDGSTTLTSSTHLVVQRRQPHDRSSFPFSVPYNTSHSRRKQHQLGSFMLRLQITFLRNVFSTSITWSCSQFSRPSVLSFNSYLAM
ncbi:hypothetical protein JRQ81_003582 [Phrynocephalus forsythii]|uniref:Uncharacterized protein n=1 Tax=Phrynocephalus forsythii TaxID=171643 RepID=A0A9Q0XL40_9SAUR|nr:hypothetical protein JRQ81_003582 [Phrynocephalus forsythii]